MSEQVRLTERRARWRTEEESARRTPGHVFAVCQRCGEAWPVASVPAYCRRCTSAVVGSTGPCPGCEHCAQPTADLPVEPEPDGGVA